MKHFFPDSFGVDHKVGKQHVKVICLDLTREDHQELIMQWALTDRCLWVHFGVPCGTASRARFRRLNKRVHGPPPLRSLKWPNGLPNVRGTNLLRLRAANRLYSFMSKLILQLDGAGITWTVENPWTSLLWNTSYWQEVDKHTNVCYVELHNCMFGGQRLKRTCIASNNNAVMSLNILCDGTHEHAPWSMQNGIFDTAREAEYTPALAKALATTILESLVGQYKLANVSQMAKKLKLSHFQAIAAGKQPTKALAFPTVPEFAFILVLANLPSSIHIPLVDNAVAQCAYLQLDATNYFVPCGCKLLRTTKKGGEIRPFKYMVEHTPSLSSMSDLALEGLHHSEQAVGTLTCLAQGKGGKCKKPCCVPIAFDETDGERYDWVFGVRWSPEVFLQQAVLVGHPFKSFSGLSDEVRAACEFVASAPYEQVVTLRCRKLGSWLQKVRQLKGEEQEIKERMPEDRRKILETKRIAFMRFVIESEGYDDKNLADDLEKGFSLVGEAPKSSVLPAKPVPATISQTDLALHSAKANTALRYMTRSSGDEELDVQLWEKTMSEVERGWMKGPLDWDTLPQGASVSRRFPLAQTGKVRPIDDLSQSQVNATVSTYEQATVDGPDVICSLAIHMMKCLANKGFPTKLLGRSLDLSSAYRQLAIADDSKDHAFLSVYDPINKRAALFQQTALPFGSRTAVNAFIRCARFLQWVAAKSLMLPLSCYFDDFVSFATPKLCDNSQSVLCLMLELFGWKYDKEGPKSDSFSESVAALGVIFKLDKTGEGHLLVCNTEKRIRDTSQFVDEVLHCGTLAKKDALSLRGKLSFCDGFIFGRQGRVALQEITRHAYASPFFGEINQKLRDALKLLRERVLEGPPRTLSCKMLETFFIFTDASFSVEHGAGLGAILLSSTGSVLEWFGLQRNLESLSFFPNGES